ncbi:MAG: heavy-metal-associated domain-containing protein [Desulfobacula sp.]|nr:heavy-metal-associated domain-containing protein [Desulfobacula sp.]
MKKFNIIMAIAACFVMVAGVVIAEQAQENSLKRVVLKVENLSCGGCFSTINKSLNPLEGFSGFGANLLRKLVAVDFVEPLTPEAIAKTITDSGYRATIESFSDITEKESFVYIQKKRALYSGNYGQGQGSCCSTGSSVQTPDKVSQDKPSYNAGGSSCCTQ